MDIESHMIYNGVICNKCKEQIASRHRHDYVTCSCGESFVDGGLEGYIRRSPDAIPIVYFSSDPHEVIRHFAARGSRGKDNKQPLEWISISKMSDEYLVAVLEYGGADWHLQIIADEIAYRNENNIKIEEDEM